jgi:hypothetical protein
LLNTFRFPLHSPYKKKCSISRSFYTCLSESSYRYPYIRETPFLKPSLTCPLETPVKEPSFTGRERERERGGGGGGERERERCPTSTAFFYKLLGVPSEEVLSPGFHIKLPQTEWPVSMAFL